MTGASGLHTQAMLTLQHGVIDKTLRHAPSKRYLKQTSHYHISRQLAVVHSSNLELAVPAGHGGPHGNGLNRMMMTIRYDPKTSVRDGIQGA